MGSVDNSGADNNVAIGYNAGKGVGQFSLIGAFSTGAGVGGVVMELNSCNNTNVDYSVAIGYTLNQLQSGQHNVGIGFQALTSANETIGLMLLSVQKQVSLMLLVVEYFYWLSEGRGL